MTVCGPRTNPLAESTRTGPNEYTMNQANFNILVAVCACFVHSYIDLLMTLIGWIASAHWRFSRKLEVAHFERSLRKSSGVLCSVALAQASGLAGVPGAVTPMGPHCTAKPYPSNNFVLAGAPLRSIFAYVLDLLLVPGSAQALTRHVWRG